MHLAHSVRLNARLFALAAAVQFISYLNLTVNFRAISAGYAWFAMVTDALASLIGYVIIRNVAKHESRWTCAGTMLGGSLAAGAGIWLTRHW